MAAVSVNCVRLTTSTHTNQIVANKLSTSKLVLVGKTTTGFPCLRTSSRFQITCSAKSNDAFKEIVDKANTTTADLTEKLVEKKDETTTTANDVGKDLVDKTNTMTTTATDSVEKLVEDTKTTTSDLIEKLVDQKDAATTTGAEVIEKLVEDTKTTTSDLIENLGEKKDATTTYINEKIAEKKDT